ncbi:GNAT family N-acetyltransferase [Rubrivivax benzoatilyticus]|uniref:GNAT family N-acetyltransferase n=1 Tax=Rubrivivax benzoatilyticus TaxID=316997 RepID=A0ABX0HYH7_9BURK|nr:GNAT family N-acetyltransferase [Rubrivivax benzoatilyticus]EGJ12434.1 GCN5-like N-acetyltransferase [Rubrivivax benzoatilyticus JA2 = ATCC BAA-35]NHK98869.1 GNAT family N-acetyltransferase [Rubrivivax benzoatilyticus]NHL24371.1 GNAT family N-acetyltransferase [Rubrivivax benzoatilyticus]
MTRLRTARLVLRSFGPADVEPYAEMCADAEVMRHIGAGGPAGRDVAWRQVAMFIGHWTLRGHGMWAVERQSDGRMLGRVGFMHPEGWPGCELGWLLARDAWGQGYAEEAARAALAWGRDVRGIVSPISLIRPANERSIRLAERLGAVADTEIDFLGDRAVVWRHVAP